VEEDLYLSAMVVAENDLFLDLLLLEMMVSSLVVLDLAC
jgi:hypothetical protein